MNFTEKEIERYTERFTSPEDTLLKELERETNLRVVQPRMLSGKVQGKFLEMLVRIIQPASVLEIGTFTGYSTLCMASGLPADGNIDTVEVDDELTELASLFIARSKYGGQITRHTGSALRIVPTLGKIYDFIFIDGDKREYPDYYRMLMGDSPYDHSCIRSGSVIIADNILWYGKVAYPSPAGDRHTSQLKLFNEMVAMDERVENVLLPVRDGLSIIRVK